MARQYFLNNEHIKAGVTDDRNPHMLYDIYLVFKSLVDDGVYDWVYSSRGGAVDPGWGDIGGMLPVQDQDFFVVTPHNTTPWYLLIGTWDNSVNGLGLPNFLGDGKATGTIAAMDGVFMRIGGQWDLGLSLFDETLYESSVYYKLTNLRMVGGDPSLSDATPLIWNMVEDQETVWFLFHYMDCLHWDNSRGGLAGYISSVVDFVDYKPICISTGNYVTRDTVESFLENPVGGGDELNHMSVQAPYKTVGVYTMAPSHYVDIDGVSGHYHSSVGVNASTSGFYVYIYAAGLGTPAYYPVGYLKYVYQFYGFGSSVSRVSDQLIFNNGYTDWNEGVSFPIDDTYGYR